VVDEALPSTTLNVLRETGMGITWNDETGTGTKAQDGRTVREQLSAAERAALRQRISIAVRERELADAEVWKQIKANGHPVSS